MRVLVCGGRNFTDYELIKRILSKYEITEIIHGGAGGADSLAGKYAFDNGIPQTVHKALWDLYGKKAGYHRNVEMADSQPDLVIAFPGGRGTKMMVDIAKNKQLMVEQVIGSYTP